MPLSWFREIFFDLYKDICKDYSFAIDKSATFLYMIIMVC